MSTFSLSSRDCGNYLLSLLPDDELAALAPHLELVELEFEQIIAERGQPLLHVYFPCNTVLSVLGKMKDGRIVEVGTIGNEGFYGIDVLLGGGGRTGQGKKNRAVPDSWQGAAPAGRQVPQKPHVRAKYRLALYRVLS